MNGTAILAGMQFAAHKIALTWAKENLPEANYQEIRKSYHATLKWTMIFVVVCCIPVMIAFFYLAMEAPFAKSAEEAVTPEGATACVLARVDYDGNFFWTHDSKKYEYPLKDYGFDANDYAFGNKVNVYVDDAQNVIKVTAVQEGMSIREIEVAVGVIGGILVPVLLICCVYLPIAYRTFAKPWRMFYREFSRK